MTDKDKTDGVVKINLEIKDEKTGFEGDIDYGIRNEDIETFGWVKMIDKMTFDIKWQILEALGKEKP